MLRIPLLACLLCLTLQPAGAELVRVGFGKDKPPYIIGEEKRGIEIEIFRQALAHGGHELVPLHFSQLNFAKALNSKRVDALSMPLPGRKDIYLSDPFVTYIDCIITKKDSGITLETLDDIIGHRVVAWPGAHLHLGGEYTRLFGTPELRKHTPEYLELDSQKAQNEMFWRDRADILVIDEYIFRWYRQYLSTTEDTTAPVKYHYLFPRETKVRASFLDKQIRDDFNEGLRALRESGQYDKIIEEFIGPLSSWQAAKPQTASGKQPTNAGISDKNARMRPN